MKIRGLPERSRNPALDPFGLCKILGHNWRDSYFTYYKKCKRCGATESRSTSLKEKHGDSGE